MSARGRFATAMVCGATIAITSGSGCSSLLDFNHGALSQGGLPCQAETGKASPDCDDGFVCMFLSCGKKCKADSECPSDSRCLSLYGGDTGACTRSADAKCDKGCPTNTKCGADNVCRTICGPTFKTCVTDQICTADGLCVGSAPHDSPGSDGGADAGGDSGNDAAMGACIPACTGAHMACDPNDNKCKLDGTTTSVGGTCGTSGADPQCGTAPNATCNDQAQDGFPGGYCSMKPCSATALCPVGATCARLGGDAAACYKICNASSDCREPSYECLAIDPLYTSGAGHKVCYPKTFRCYSSADCPTVKPTCAGANVDAGTAGTCA